MHSGNDRERVDAFVRRHFGFLGSLRLHRAALGWDLLRASVNVMLSPVYLLTRVLALLLSAVGFRKAGRWLASRPIFFHSALARSIERRVETELWAPGAPPGAALTDTQQWLLREYTSVRTSVSEICTTLIVLTLGFALFRNATPGVVSLAPLVSDYVAQSSAIADFPLGQWAGHMWYGVFPVRFPIWFVLAIGVGLAVAASFVTTFAGIVADPLQARLGIHQRRLIKLLAALDAEDALKPTLAREHAVARLADLTDAGVSLLRVLRG